MAPEKSYRYRRSDFRPLPVTLEHMDVRLRFLDGRVEGRNTLRMTARRALREIRLDARDLEIRAVEWAGDRPEPLRHDYRPEEAALVVRLPGEVPPGGRFSVRIDADCSPSDRILEGIYLDTPPPGCPPQYVSQCQQWGFQRILPVFDDCTAKCTMTTALEADARYTHLISNGNVCRAANPGGRPVPVPGDPSRQAIAYVNDIPMAPYLFVVCVGTWDVLEDEIVYPSGRRVKLEYLVPPGRRAGAAAPMRILKEAVLWQGRTQEYEYARDVYRTICMEKSNFGGMENVGNTTIITEAALIDAYTTDERLRYAHGVIVHEFEHNQCGSDVTMETPFDMWLNEAFTVDVERQFTAGQFDPDASRLDEVDAMRAPLHGPLAVEDGGHQGQIVREGFNDPDELVDGVTYVKAAEAIRMLRLILGAETFRRAKDLYFRRHTGGNANTGEFFACFEEASGRDLAAFRREWLHTIGYPRVSASWGYDEGSRTLTVRLRQSRSGHGGPFHVPVALAAVDEAGRDIPGTAGVVELTGPERVLTYAGIPRPAFVSLNRDCSFYGSFEDESATAATLAAQIRLDPNGFNRVEAMRRLTDVERIRLIADPGTAAGEAWLRTFGALLRDGGLRPGLKAYLLRIDELSLDRRYLPWYRERCRARRQLLQAAAERFRDELLAAFLAVDTYAPARDPKDGVGERLLKSVLLRTLVECRSRPAHDVAEEHFRRAWHISDKVSGLHAVNLGDHPGRRRLMEEALALWRDHLPAYTSYLRVVGGGVHDDVWERIAEEERRPPFRVEHPSHSRALYQSMAANNRMLWTGRGIAWAADTVVRLAAVNDNTALRLLACFQLVDKLAGDLKPQVVAALEAIRAGVDPAKAPSTAGRAAAYLQGVS